MATNQHSMTVMGQQPMMGTGFSQLMPQHVPQPVATAPPAFAPVASVTATFDTKAKPKENAATVAEMTMVDCCA